MQWTILGAGAIGSLFATHLLRTGQDVNLLDTRCARQHASHPMMLELLDGSFCMCELPCISHQAVSDLTLLLVTTKVWQVIPALEALVGKLPSSCPIVLLHNGMGPEEWLLTHFPQNPLLTGVTSCGAFKKDPHHIKHTGLGETWLGALNEAGTHYQSLIPPLVNALSHAAWSDQIRERQWRKLVVNAIINPLTALYNQPNGMLSEHKAEVNALCEELYPLLIAEGFTEPVTAWCDVIFKVAEQTAQNYSSMQQDLAHQRKTEIDYITGYLLQQAEKIGIKLPLHQDLYLKIKKLESTFTT